MSLTLTEQLKNLDKQSLNNASRKEYMYAMKKDPTKRAKKQAMEYAQSGFDLGLGLSGDSEDKWIFVRMYDKKVPDDLLDSSEIFLVDAKLGGGRVSLEKKEGWFVEPQVDSSLDSSLDSSA